MKRGFLLQRKAPKQAQSNASATTKPTATASSADKVAAATPESPKISLPSGAPSVLIPTGVSKMPEKPSVVIFPVGEQLMVTHLPPFTVLPWEQQTTSLIWQSMKPALVDNPEFPGLFRPPPNPPVYRIKPAHSGLGVFAVVDLMPGDLIARERPLFVMPQGLPTGPMFTDPCVILKMAIGNMPPADRAAFYKLANCKEHALSQEFGILDTNTLPLNGGLPGYEATCGGIARDITRANHSCSPNAQVVWDLLPFVFELHTIRPIRAGEEITITYTHLFNSRADRQSDLQAKYSFRCTCAACSLPAAEGRRSDVRRSVLGKEADRDPADESELRAWVADTSEPDMYLVDRFRRVVDMMEEEGIADETTWPRPYQGLVKAYCALEMEAEARLWADKASQLARASHGGDTGWKAVIEDPKRTDWWGLRAKAKRQATLRKAAA